MTPQREAAYLAVVKALEPFAAFADAFRAKPIWRLDDRLYSIHAGTEWEASFRLSDCIAARYALKALAEAAEAEKVQG